MPASAGMTRSDIMVEHVEKNIPQHIAIVMDGNRRWAKSRGLPRFVGHIAGVEALRRAVTYCVSNNVKALTVFAFSSENRRRPEDEVGHLKKLFLRSLKKEIKELHQRNIRIDFIGDLTYFPASLQEEIVKAKALTQHNSGLTFVLAVNYGGRWDIMQAAKRLAQAAIENKIDVNTMDEISFSRYLSLADLPEPDLFIRTGGECRISNFLLWQLAYTELYFSNVLWSDLTEKDLDEAVKVFSQRDRRFGKV